MGVKKKSEGGVKKKLPSTESTPSKRKIRKKKLPFTECTPSKGKNRKKARSASDKKVKISKRPKVTLQNIRKEDAREVQYPDESPSAWPRKKATKEKIPPRMDPKTVGYFRRVDDTLQQKFDSDEEKRLFVRNVFEEVKGNEMMLAMDMTGSLVLQKLLALAHLRQVQRFLFALSTDFRSACCHRSGAHIVQTTLLQFPRLQEESQTSRDEEDDEEEEEGDAPGTLEELILMLCADVKEKFLDYNQNTHGSFVVRTLFQVLGGTILTQEAVRRGPGSIQTKKKLNTSSAQVADFEVPESFLKKLEELSSCFQEHIAVFVTHKIASLGLQVALQVLFRKLPEVCCALCDNVIGYLASRNPSSECSPLSIFLKDQTTSRLLEKILEVSGKKQLKKLFKSQFKGQLLVLSAHPIANYTVQRLIAAVPTQKLFEKVFDELSPGVEDVMAKGHMGVVTALVTACRKFKSRQAEMVARLMEIFHCLEPVSRQVTCVPLFLSLLAYEVYYGLEEGDSSEYQAEQEKALGDVNFHGSLLLQQLLHFTDPSPVLLSLTAMTDKDLVTVACSQAGSHVFDVLLSSESIPEKKAKKVVRKLKGHYFQLACNRYGSRVLDQIWNAATLGVKQEMAQELAVKERELLGDQFGYHIVRNFALSHFLKRRRDWDEHQVAENKRRKMFAEILEDRI